MLHLRGPAIHDCMHQVLRYTTVIKHEWYLRDIHGLEVQSQ